MKADGIMTTKIRDLTVEEFRNLISTVVKETFEELLEDLAALSSDEFIASIKEARRDIQEGLTKPFEEVFDV